MSVPENFSAILNSYTSQGGRMLGLAHARLNADLSWENIQQLSRSEIWKI